MKRCFIAGYTESSAQILYKICQLFYTFTMEIIEVATGLRNVVVVNTVESQDWQVITKKRYSFAWQSIKQTATVYKLHIDGEDDILGLIGLVDV